MPGSVVPRAGAAMSGGEKTNRLDTLERSAGSNFILLIFFN